MRLGLHSTGYSPLRTMRQTSQLASLNFGQPYQYLVPCLMCAVRRSWQAPITFPFRMSKAANNVLVPRLYSRASYVLAGRAFGD